MYQCKGYEMLTGYEIHYFGLLDLILRERGVTIQNGQCLFKQINCASNLTTQIKLLHNLNP